MVYSCRVYGADRSLLMIFGIVMAPKMSGNGELKVDKGQEKGVETAEIKVHFINGSNIVGWDNFRENRTLTQV